MQVNVIHLYNTQHSQERLESFQKEFSNQGIKYKIWPGVRNVNVVKAISLAHKQIIKHAKDHNLPEVCIAEDDIIFLGKGAFEFYLENKPENYDIYLGGLSDILRRENDYITDFRGLTLYTVHNKFYDIFLSASESINIDAAMKAKGQYYLCPKVVCSQYAGYSYHKKGYVDYSHKLKQYNLYEG